MFKKHDSTENTAPTSLRPGGSNSPSLGQDTTPSSTSTAPSSQASIGPSIRINGDIAGNENLVVNGQVSGSIALPNNMLVIGKQGSVDADVSAKSVEIEGKVAGTVQAAELVRVKPSGQVKGDIGAPRVVLEDGCQFRGGIDMQEQKIAGVNKPTESKEKTNGATPPQGKVNPANIENTAKI